MTGESAFEYKEIRCPVCDGGETAFVGWRGGEAHHAGQGEKTAIVRCKKCTHQYPNPMPFPKAGLDELYVDGDEYFLGHDIGGKKQAGLNLMKEFEAKLGRKGSFLDVGCGAGELLWAATQSGWEAEGVDPSSEFIEIGRTRLGVEGKNLTLEAAAYPDNYFDAVAMGGIIEHLYDPHELLIEVSRVLRPGGWLWFDAPNEDGLYSTFGNLYMRLQRKDWVVVMAPTFAPYHVQGFNPRSVRTILNRTDLTVRDLQVVGGVCEQTGERSFRKRVEYQVANLVNQIGRVLKRGSYMSVWVQKSVN
ncbi:MAG: class I SAM-dependent methyltransferase [Pyrinomonadaceae bacterium]